MSVTAVQANELFVIRTHKFHVQNPAITWVNNYEVQAVDAAQGTEALVVAMQGIVAFERAFHLPLTAFDRVVISTWLPDSQPYNPDNLMTLQLNGARGTRSTGSNSTLDERQPLEAVLWAHRSSLSGRAGKMFYRGCLVEMDVNAPAGELSETTINDPVGIRQTFDQAATLPQFSYLVGGGEPGEVRLVLVSKDGTSVRPVYSLGLRGVNIIKRNHRYFDRS